MSNKRRNNLQTKGNLLPPILQDDDGELPFFKSDMFSDLTILVGQRKLFTSRCLLAYNSPVFEKQLASMKKQQDLDWSSRSLDDIVELLCYLDPRVPYTITVQTAKQLLPLAEEFEIRKLFDKCEYQLYEAYEKLRKERSTGVIPQEVNEEFIILADRFSFNGLMRMCIEEYVNNPNMDATKSIAMLDTVSDSVKLMILERKLARLNKELDIERKYKKDVNYMAAKQQPKTLWKN